jgi:hypothetical protein
MGPPISPHLRLHGSHLDAKVTLLHIPLREKPHISNISIKAKEIKCKLTEIKARYLVEISVVELKLKKSINHSGLS